MSDAEPPTGADTSAAEETPATEPELGGRLHPAVIVQWTLRGVLPLAAVLFASNAMQQVAVVAGLAFVVAAAAVRWWRFQWWIEPDQLVIERGLLQRTRRVIPIERVQAVQAVRKLYHRVFGVLGLRVEAIGGSETEGQLDALDREVARRVHDVLTRRAARARSEDPPATLDASTRTEPSERRSIAAEIAADTPQGPVLAHCTPRMLLVAGLTGGRVGVAAAIIGLAQQVYGNRLAEAAVTAPQRFGVVVLLALIAAGLIAAFVLSIIATAVTYWDFTARRDGDLLRLRRGLLDERRDTVPLARVQSITVEQNILRRALGLATVKMVVAGRAGGDSDVTGTLLPIASRADAVQVVADLMDVADLDQVELTPMPAAARRRRLTRAAVVSSLLATGGLVFAWPYGLAGLATAAITIPIALESYRALGWVLHDETVIAQAGWLVRRLSVTPALGTQSADLSRSPFQRRVGVATLTVEIARTRSGRDPRLIDIAEADGRVLLRTLAETGADSARLQVEPETT